MTSLSTPVSSEFTASQYPMRGSYLINREAVESLKNPVTAEVSDLTSLIIQEAEATQVGPADFARLDRMRTEIICRVRVTLDFKSNVEPMLPKEYKDYVSGLRFGNMYLQEDAYVQVLKLLNILRQI